MARALALVGDGRVPCVARRMTLEPVASSPKSCIACRPRRLAGALLALAASLGVLPAAWAGATDQLREFVSGTRSARGEFTQRQIRSNGQAGPVSSGSFVFQRPGRFRWEVRKPFAQTVVADGERLWTLDEDLNQVTVRRIGEVPGGSPAAILFGAGDLERTFTLKDAGSRDGLEWLDATPKSRDAGFERIGIGFRDGMPETMEIRDTFGQTSVLAFRGLERNPRLAAEAFRFVAPKGADVIEQ